MGMITLMKDASDIIKPYKTEKGIRYGFDFQLKGIRCRRKSFISADEAYAVALQIRLDIFSGNYEPARYFEKLQKDITLETFWTNHHLPLMKKTLKLRTTKNRISVFTKHILPVLGKVKLRALDSDKLEGYLILKIKEGLATSSLKHQHIIAIQALTRDAVKLGYIKSQPPIRIDAKLKKTKAVLTKSQMKSLIVAISKDAEVMESRIKNLVRILFWTGLRLGEALALKAGDIDFTSMKINVTKTLAYKSNEVTTPKTGTNNSIPIHPEAIQPLRDAIKEASINPEGWLFKETDSDRFIYPQKVRSQLTKIAKDTLGEALGKKVTPHTLRRSLGSMLIDDNTPVDVVARLLRHTPETLLGHYNATNTTLMKELFQSFSLE